MSGKRNKSKPLVVERLFDAPIGQVWKAISDKEEMKAWYFDIKEFKAKQGVEFQFTVEHKGFKYVHLCKIMEVIPQKKLAYTWRYQGHEGNSLVTFELFSQGAKTKLRLTHTGLECFPKIPAFARKNFEFGWISLIGESLKKFLGQKDVPERQIVISRLIDAPVKRVWEAWTDPRQVAQWWGPKGFTTTIEKMDATPGGVWKHIMHGPDGTDYPNKSVFVEVVKHERIVYSNSGGKKGSQDVSFVSAWTFEAQGDKTRITIRHVFPTIEDRDRVVKEYGAIEGGKQCLSRLAKFVKT